MSCARAGRLALACALCAALTPALCLSGCAHESGSRSAGATVTDARDLPADGSLERLATLDVTLLAMAPSIAGGPLYDRLKDLRERVRAARDLARTGSLPPADLTALEGSVHALVNDARAQGTEIPALEESFGELLLVHTAEREGIPLETTFYEVDGWRTAGEGSRMELRRLLPAGEHGVRIEGSSDQQTFGTAFTVQIQSRGKTLVACDTLRSGVALDLACTVNGRPATGIGGPVAWQDPGGEVVELAEPTAVAEPMSAGEPTAETGGEPGSGEVGDATESGGDDVRALLRNQRQVVAGLRQRFDATTAGDAELRAQVASSIADLESLLADMEEQTSSDPTAAQSLLDDGQLSAVGERIESLQLVVHVLEQLHDG